MPKTKLEIAVEALLSIKNMPIHIDYECAMKACVDVARLALSQIESAGEGEATKPIYKPAFEPQGYLAGTNGKVIVISCTICGNATRQPTKDYQDGKFDAQVSVRSVMSAKEGTKS